MDPKMRIPLLPKCKCQTTQRQPLFVFFNSGVNPTSPLGLGGLAWGIGGYVVLTLRGEVYLSPYPLSLASGRSGPAPP